LPWNIEFGVIPIPYLYTLVLSGCKLTQNIAITQLFRQKADLGKKKLFLYLFDNQYHKILCKKKSKKKGDF
jgi:hypothetical protein